MVVTVVCICYNQGRFIREAVDSVLNQTHQPVELWILDDGSTDDSPDIIRNIQREHPQIRTYLSPANTGHNQIFNKFLSEYKGEAIIDLAADDILLPDRITEGVNAFSNNSGCGVNFTNAELIDEDGNYLRYQYPVGDNGQAVGTIRQGDLFADLIGTYFINPASMMIRTEVLDRLGGFDASLSYEDFDFWVRSAREFRYCYTDRILIKKRIHEAAFSKQQYRFGSLQMRDTFRVCRKIPSMIRNDAERKAYHRRIGYEMRQCIRHGNIRLFFRYLTQL